MNSSKISKSIFWVCLIIILIGLYCLRIYNIEADLPDFGMTYYRTLSEGQYGRIALYKTIYDTISPANCSMGGNYKNDAIGSFATLVGLKLFGDNYFGFRSGSIVTGLMCFILIFLIYKRLSARFEEGNSLKFFAASCGIILLDFTFTLASRIVETSIYRLFFVLLSICIASYIEFDKTFKDKMLIILLGFVSIIAVFAVYITNIFLTVAIFLWIIICNRKKLLEKIDYIALFILGACIAFIICDIYYYRFWDSSCIGNVMYILNVFGGQERKTGGYSLPIYFKIPLQLYHFLSANSNLYNLTIIMLFLSGFPIAVKLSLKEEHKSLLLMLLVYLFMMLQSSVYDDYVMRKYIIVYPITNFVVFYLYLCKDELISMINKKKKAWIIYIFLCFGTVSMIPIYRLFLEETGLYKDFGYLDKVIVLIQIIGVLAIFITEVILLASSKTDKKSGWIKKMIIIMLIFTLGVNGYLSLRYVYCYRYYTERDTMISIGEIVGDAQVYGSYSIGYTLYNDIKPVVNGYELMENEINNSEPGVWFLDYSDYKFPAELKNNTKYNWTEAYVFPIKLLTLGEHRNISLYYLE